MKYLLFTYFKDKPELLNIYSRLRPVLVNVLLLVTLCMALLAKSEKIRSFSVGFATGLVLINTGESIGRLRSNGNKKIQVGSESVNG